MSTRKIGARLALVAMTAAVGTLVLVGTATTAAADPQGRDGFVVTVPFAFVAGARELPAGTYRVEMLPTDTDPEVLATLQSVAADHFPQMVLQSVPVKNVLIDQVSQYGDQPRLVFDKVGKLPILKEIEE